uniref:Uncharacterized protein n=1 Tax=Rhizophora mucronata TaxID=61149 RepID=A0A2P2R3M2_RHIMU
MFLFRHTSSLVSLDAHLCLSHFHEGISYF